MNNTLTNYTNQQRAEFMEYHISNGKRIEKYDNTLYSLAEDEVVENGQIIIDDNRLKNLRKEQFEREFFNTSLGWVSRNVHMQNGEIWDFLKDIKPNLKENTLIITYTPNEDYTTLVQNKNVIVTEQFLQECEQQLFKDFYGA